MGKRYANGNAVFPWDATRYEGWIQRVSELEFQEDEDYVLWEMCKFLEDHGYINTEKDQLAACLTHMLMKSWYKNVTGNVRDEIRRYLASREGENFSEYTFLNYLAIEALDGVSIYAWFTPISTLAATC